VTIWLLVPNGMEYEPPVGYFKTEAEANAAAEQLRGSYVVEPLDAVPASFVENTLRDWEKDKIRGQAIKYYVLNEQWPDGYVPSELDKRTARHMILGSL
jgi:hypothetical protein